MCLQCHQGLSDEYMISTLKDEAVHNYTKWNTTSVSHIILTALGMNGPVARELAIDIFEKFIEWRKTMPHNYLPESGLEQMTPTFKLEHDLNYIKTSRPNYADKHSILENYANHKKYVEAAGGICSVQ